LGGLQHLLPVAAPHQPRRSAGRQHPGQSVLCPASRLLTLGDGDNDWITYSYLDSSPLVSQFSFNNNGALEMITTKTYDLLNRLSAVSSAPAGAALAGAAYQYNAAGQRVRSTMADNSYWVYGFTDKEAKGSKQGGFCTFDFQPPIPTPSK
jgi:hypothetical protein